MSGNRLKNENSSVEAYYNQNMNKPLSNSSS